MIVVFSLGFGVGDGKIALRWPIFKTASSTKGVVEGPPVEFLFIDVDRLGSYLAQLKGGTFTKESLGEKVVKTASGSVEVVSVLKGGVSAQEENFVEREVTPTASSSFFELEEALKDRGNSQEKRFLHNFHKHVEGRDKEENLEDGDFVRFKAVVRGPVYLNPYVAQHHAATTSALFPVWTRAPAARKRAKARRRAAEKFERQVGKDPRAVLSLEPIQKGTSRTRGVKFLMPVHLDQLNQEPSLLNAGGMFTVVGKVVRVFAQHRRAPHGPIALRHSYVDIATQQTWQRPLRTAPDELICRASYACSTMFEGPGRTNRAERRRWTRRMRRRMLRALKRGTRIDGTGAVILPVAIYR